MLQVECFDESEANKAFNEVSRQEQRGQTCNCLMGQRGRPVTA